MMDLWIGTRFLEGQWIGKAVEICALLMVLQSGGPGSAGTEEDNHCPCQMSDVMQSDEPTLQRLVNSQCKYPCTCTSHEIECKAGVNIVKDGCDCCFMCARQQGDLCNYRDKCDDAKGLYCDPQMGDSAMGVCRARAAKSCAVDGVTYKDGEEFKPSCSKLCSCQNGVYACASLCPQEDRRPSSVHCNEPTLVAITGRCCKEWICSNVKQVPETEDEPSPQIEHRAEICKYESTSWSACSVTCGMGVSMRITNENNHCQSVEQRRLCFVRPCEKDDKHMIGKDCKSTWKEHHLQYLEHNGCTSTQQFKLKFCSTCKKHKCCGPGKTSTIHIEFNCVESSQREVQKFMWIRTCECYPRRRCPFTY